MRACPSCGHQNADDVDFCANCGQYVRWEPTRIGPNVKSAEQAAVAAPEAPPAPPAAPAGDGAPAAPPPAQNAQAPPAPAPPGAMPPPAGPAEAPPIAAAPDVPPDSVLLAPRLPDQESPPGEPVTVNVDPGGQVSMLVLIRNQSEIVDNYDIAIAGIPDHWWTVYPPTVYLVPYGTSEEGFEQEVEIRFNPPRAPESEARAWPMAVTAYSRAHNVQIAHADATLVIAPYQEIDSEMRPERKAGRKKARFAVAVRNRANAPVNVGVSAVDAENKTRIEFEHPQFPTRPGRRSGTIFWVKPLKQVWIGRSVDHRFTLDAKTIGYDAAAIPKMGVFVQKAWLPYWLLIILPLLIVAAILLYLLWPRTAKIPDVRVCGTVICAQKLLESKGLELGETIDFPTQLRKAGSAVGTKPSIGTEVDKGTKVDVRVAVEKGEPKVEVPDLKGKTLAQADTELRKLGLQRGAVTPQPKGPDDEISGQIPKAGERAAKGTPIDLFLVEPTAETTTDGTTTTEEPPPPPSPPGPPPVGPQGPLGPTAVAGTNLPDFRIVFDNGKDILTAPAYEGKPVKALVKTKEIEEEPSLSPDGKLVAYRRGTRDKAQIFVVDPARPLFARAVTNAGFDDQRPAFSPDGSVIAFIRTLPAIVDPENQARDSDLCFAAAGASSARPSCITDPATIVSRPVWSPSGRSILVLSRPSRNARQIEVEQFTSARENSRRAADWNSAGLITDEMHDQERFGDVVHSVAWSADGTRVAFAANWGNPAPRVVLAKAEDDAISDPKTLARITACQVAFALEGSALAIIEQDNRCIESGRLLRLDPDDPTKLVPLTNPRLGAQNPVWARKASG